MARSPWNLASTKERGVFQVLRSEKWTGAKSVSEDVGSLVNHAGVLCIMGSSAYVIQARLCQKTSEACGSTCT